jgi:hypothetical protein
MHEDFAWGRAHKCPTIYSLDLIYGACRGGWVRRKSLRASGAKLAVAKGVGQGGFEGGSAVVAKAVDKNAADGWLGEFVIEAAGLETILPIAVVLVRRERQEARLRPRMLGALLALFLDFLFGGRITFESFGNLP